MKNFYYNYLTSIAAPEFYALQNVVNDYWQKSKDFQKTSNDSENKNGLTMESTEITLNDNQIKNPFVEYTDHLTEILQEKNHAYGDSFTKSIDKYGLSVIGVRLSDKYNRIEHLITHHELKENDESLEDTLLDMAGYAILGLKYLEEHKN